MNGDWELTHSVKINPWARAIWERKHPEGPVLVVWQLWPLPYYVTGWIPFAGRKCIPMLASAVHVEEPALVDSMVAQLGEEAFSLGPSIKMVGHSQSIAAAYAANGKKGGRPKKKATERGASGIETPSQGDSTPTKIAQLPAVVLAASRPEVRSPVAEKISNGPRRNERVWCWRMFGKRGGLAYRLSRFGNEVKAWNLIVNTNRLAAATHCTVEIVHGEDMMSPAVATPLENATPEECLAFLERVCAEVP